MQHGALVTLGYLGAVCNKQLQHSPDTELGKLLQAALERIGEIIACTRRLLV